MMRFLTVAFLLLGSLAAQTFNNVNFNNVSVSTTSGGGGAGVAVSASPTQAALSYTAPDSSSCTVHVYTDSARTKEVNDTAYFGSTDTTKNGSYVNGTARVVVVGQRRISNVSTTWYSRALENNAPHWGTVTCSDAIPRYFTFTTPVLPADSYYADLLPTDANANFVSPTINTSLLLQKTVDPYTGVPTWNLINDTLSTDLGVSDYPEIKCNATEVPASCSSPGVGNCHSCTVGTDPGCTGGSIGSTGSKGIRGDYFGKYCLVGHVGAWMNLVWMADDLSAINNLGIPRLNTLAVLPTSGNCPVTSNDVCSNIGLPNFHKQMTAPNGITDDGSYYLVNETSYFAQPPVLETLWRFRYIGDNQQTGIAWNSNTPDSDHVDSLLTPTTLSGGYTQTDFFKLLLDFCTTNSCNPMPVRCRPDVGCPTNQTDSGQWIGHAQGSVGGCTAKQVKKGGNGFGDPTKEYLLAECNSGDQDSLAWYAVYDLGDHLPLGSCVNCIHVIAAAPTYGFHVARWSTNHGGGFQPGNGILVAYPPNDPGTFSQYMASKLASNLTSGASSMTLVADAQTLKGDPIWTDISGNPTTATHFSVQSLAVGDLMMLIPTGQGLNYRGGELVKITSLNSDHTVVGIGRNCSSAPSPADGITKASGFNVGCTTTGTAFSSGNYVTPISTLDIGNLSGANGQLVFWDPIHDPLGNDTTLTYSTFDISGYSHAFISGDHIGGGSTWYSLNGAEAASFKDGNILSTAQSWPTYVMGYPNSFESKQLSQIGSNIIQTHLSFGQDRSVAGGDFSYAQNIFPFVGGNTVTVTNVTGQIYRVTSDMFLTEKLPYFAISDSKANVKILKDISGPGSLLTNGAGGNYTFCVAHVANECWSGSTPGQIFVSMPSTPAACNPAAGGNDFPSGVDICVSTMLGVEESIAQIDSSPTVTTSSTSGIHPPADIVFAKSGFVRSTIRGLKPQYRNGNVFGAPSTTPDGKYMTIATNLSGRGYVVAAKMPPVWTSDSVDRTKFIRVTVNPPVVASATHTIVEFGYCDQLVNNGATQCDPATPASYFYGTARSETTVAASSTFDATNWFFYETTDAGSYTGVDCSTTCSIVIPAISGKTLYWRPVYRNNANAIVSTGAMRVQVVQ